MTKSISEILAEASKLKNRDEKVAFLQQNDNVTLRTVLKYMYDYAETSLLPKGPPPYTPSNSVESAGMLQSETRRLRIFFEGNGYDHLDPLKREVLFINILEAVDPEDAKLLIKMKDRSKIHGISVQIIRDAFPGLIKQEKKGG